MSDTVKSHAYADKVIVDDALSFLSHNFEALSKPDLVATMNDYYDEKILHRSMINLLSITTKLPPNDNLEKIKSKDLVTKMYNCYEKLSPVDRPIFVCRDLNSIPSLPNFVQSIKTEKEECEDIIDISEFKKEHEILSKNLATVKETLEGMNFTIKSLTSDDTIIGTRKQNEYRSNAFVIVDNMFDENIGHFSIFRCSSCQYSSNEEQTILDHDCQNEHANQYTCKFCDYKQHSLHAFNSHLAEHKKIIPELKYECVLCTFQSDEKEIYREHLGHHSWKKPYRCSKCVFRTHDETRMKNHSIAHIEFKGENHYECILCDRVCGSRDALDKHKRMHLRNLPHVCLYCGISYSSQAALFFHLLSHTKENSFPCRFCDHSSHSRHYMMMHETSHLRKEDFSCHICNKVLANRFTLKLHVLKMHTGVKNFSCDICSRKFAFERDLIKHKRKVHTQFKEYICKYCLNKYKSKSYYEVHLATHKQNAM